MYTAEYSDFPDGEKKQVRGFDTADEAWAHLAHVRETQEQNTPGGPFDLAQFEDTDTLTALRYVAWGEHKHGHPTAEYPTTKHGAGRVLGCEPGRELDDSAPDWSYEVRRR